MPLPVSGETVEQFEASGPISCYESNSPTHEYECELPIHEPDFSKENFKEQRSAKFEEVSVDNLDMDVRHTNAGPVTSGDIQFHLAPETNCEVLEDEHYGTTLRCIDF